MRIVPILLASCLALAAVSAASASKSRACPYPRAGYQNYPSPDHTLQATVVFLPAQRDRCPESVVNIRSASGRLLAYQDYSSGIEAGHFEAGHFVAQARWTPDSRFFVLSLESSGGHSPWHNPMHFYSRRRRKFYGIDDFIEGQAITSARFHVRGPATVWVRNRANMLVRIDLRRLEKKLTRASERTDYDNY